MNMSLAQWRELFRIWDSKQPRNPHMKNLEVPWAILAALRNKGLVSRDSLKLTQLGTYQIKTGKRPVITKKQHKG